MGKNDRRINYKTIVVLLFLMLAFLFGRAVGTVEQERKTAEKLEQEDSVTEETEKEKQVASVSSQSQNWGLGFGEEGTTPMGNATAEQLKEYNAYYVGPSASQPSTHNSTNATDSNATKKLYLTFDAGFENGYTEAILDALEKHNVKATFFVVGHYLETAPELVKRMVEEGHTVGNHTYHHKDMSSIADQKTFEEELESVEQLYQEIVGAEMLKFYRPPQGKFSTQNLSMAKDLGYHTFFWSLAYVDWIKEDQPTKEEAFDKLLKRVHPGAIVLLHSTSETNAKILDELLTKWEEMGYEFGTLWELVSSNT